MRTKENVKIDDIKKKIEELESVKAKYIAQVNSCNGAIQVLMALIEPEKNTIKEDIPKED